MADDPSPDQQTLNDHLRQILPALAAYAGRVRAWHQDLAEMMHKALTPLCRFYVAGESAPPAPAGGKRKARAATVTRVEAIRRARLADPRGGWKAWARAAGCSRAAAKKAWLRHGPDAAS